MSWVGLAALSGIVGYFVFEFLRIRKSQHQKATLATSRGQSGSTRSVEQNSGASGAVLSITTSALATGSATE